MNTNLAIENAALLSQLFAVPSNQQKIIHDASNADAGTCQTGCSGECVGFV